MQILDTLNTLVMERRLVWSGMEIEITWRSTLIEFHSLLSLSTPTSKDLIAPFSAEDHFHAHGFDFATQEIHRRARAHCRDIVCFEMVDDIFQCIQSFLHRKGVFVMDGAKICGSLSGGQQIW